ncbi:site-specific integrase [Roseomonas gilardii]|uniref:Site-specific integrase n=1 Tax=Roseomonas gilardii TaxID=257708 RepID=A0ABU3ML03_9PROT|nr:site-specific integrase [Roseomonas gilardii]MDT8333183.1 site-specific integrase [Roseomonas gilardii]
MKDHDPRAAGMRPAPPALVSAVPSFADAAAAVAGWGDLPATRRRDLRSALTTAARLLERPPSAVPCDVAWLNETLFGKPPGAHHMGARGFGNMVSGLRTVLRRLDLHAPDQRTLEGMSPAWKTLLGHARQEAQAACLKQLARYCAGQGTEPDTMSDAVLAGWAAADRRLRLGADAGGRAAIVARAWNDAVTASGLALPRLRAPRRRTPYTLPFTDYPRSFQDDLERFGATLQPAVGAGLWRRSRVPGQKKRILRPRSVATRLFSIRQAAGLLVRGGVPAGEIRSLRDLVWPLERVELILDAIIARSTERRGGQVWTVAVALLRIAQLYAEDREHPLDAGTLATIKEWVDDTKPDPRAGLPPRVRERIRALTQPAAYARLLHEPARLMQLAKGQGLAPAEAARQARLAAMLEILTICPMRLSNLLGLRLDRHLRYLDHRGRRLTHLVIAGHEVKNGEPIEWPVPEESARLIERYIRSYRPGLAGADNPYLFPGTGDGPLSATAFSNHLKRHLWEVTGVEVNPHLMRSFAAWLHLRHHPEAIDEVRRILGHRSAETTMRHYILFEKEAAALRYDRNVLRLREETRGLALASRLSRRPAVRAGVGR